MLPPCLVSKELEAENVNWYISYLVLGRITQDVSDKTIFAIFLSEILELSEHLEIMTLPSAF